MKEMRGRVAVVTGAANGIGRALAARLATEGMKVVLADIEEEPLAAAAEEIGATGASVLAVPTDVSKAAAVDTLARRTLEAFGAVHVLCNNAGVSAETAAVWENTLADWQWVLGVNLWGVIHGVRSFLPIMLAQGTEGHVVNTASMGGLLSVPFGAVYHASKHAVVTISESLHFELEILGAAVKVSVLCPGPVKTGILESEGRRPPELRARREHVCEDAQMWQQIYRQTVADGDPPERVADQVVEAIRQERFYIFPHPEILDAVRARTETLMKQGKPTLFVPEKMQARFSR